MLTSEEFNKAKEALKKAQACGPYWAVIAPDPIPEPDTYTLIPNGEELTDKQGGWKKIKSYLVQHDQTGNTIKWCGCSADAYYEYYMINSCLDDPLKGFGTFLDWPNYGSKGRKGWKGRELKRLEKEADKPMLNSMECIPCFTKPVEEVNPYEYWDLDSLYDYLDNLIWDDEDPYYDEEKYRMVNEAINKLEKEENNMHCYNSANTAIVAAAQPESVDQREYLLHRLRDVSSKKDKDLFAFFKLNPVAGPKTVKDLVQKIKDGDFTFDENEGDEREYWNTQDVVSSIRWTKDKPDRKGYDAAIALKKDAFTKTFDIIKIMSPEEGLKALQAFEAQDFH